MRVKRSVCVPAGADGMMNRPSGPVAAPMVVPTTCTLALASGCALALSVMVPVIRPVWACASAAVDTRKELTRNRPLAHLICGLRDGLVWKDTTELVNRDIVAIGA